MAHALHQLVLAMRPHASVFGASGRVSRPDLDVLCCGGLGGFKGRGLKTALSLALLAYRVDINLRSRACKGQGTGLRSRCYGHAGTPECA